MARRSPTRTAYWLLELLEPFDSAGVEDLDGSAPGPGPTLTPDLLNREGERHGDPGYRYAVAESSIELAGTPLRTQGGWRLYELEPPAPALPRPCAASSGTAGSAPTPTTIASARATRASSTRTPAVARCS